MSKKWAGGLLITFAGLAILNRLGSRRGATNDEVRQPIAGDELVPEAMLETTHGVTINAPAESIWPWLLQVGYHRGGWYADSKITEFLFKYLFEPIAPKDKKPEYRPSADRIMLEYQELRVGDIVPDGPPGTVRFIVKELEPNRQMVLYTDQYHQAMVPESFSTTWFQPISAFSWVFALKEIHPGETRLVLRARISFWPRAIFPLLWLPLMLGEAVFPNLMLSGIKQRVERTTASPDLD
jgi:hypothetical protein